jgi:hypothetical protein
MSAAQISQTRLEAKPVAADQEFTPYGAVEAVLSDSAKPLVFRAGFSVQPATLTLASGGQVEPPGQTR